LDGPRGGGDACAPDTKGTVRNLQKHRFEHPMFDYRRILLWLVVLLAPGGLLLLPVLLADARRAKARKEAAATPTPPPVNTPEAERPLAA
jgi:hypothetical protein